MGISVRRGGIWVTSAIASGTAPTVPQNVVVTSTVAGQIDVSWAAPASPGSSPINGYEVVLTPVSGAALVVNVGAAVRSTSVTSLTVGKLYSVTVQAGNAVGLSTTSAAILVTVASSSGASLWPTDNTTVGWRGAGVSAAQLKASGSITVSTPGAVLDLLDVSGTITVNADNVTIKRSRVTSGTSGMLIRNNGANLNVSFVEVIGNNSGGACIGFSNYNADHCDLHGTEDGLKVGSNSAITNNFIHDLFHIAGTTHNDCIQISGAASQALIQHNYMRNDFNQTSAVHIKCDFGAIDHVTVDANFMEGGGYTVYGGNEIGSTGFGPATAITISNNVIGQDVYPTGGQFGPKANLCKDSASSYVNNKFADGTAA